MPWKRPAGRTEIVHIVVTGYQKRKYPRKYYVFVIDVTWNNSDRFEIYRRYSDFFSFQTTLKAMFPAAAGRRNEERIIPQLPKRIFVGRSHVARVAEARLEQINRYCQTLISLDPKISESAHVIGFFSPRIGDKALPKLHLHRPASLHPQKIPAGSLFEEHCALAEYEAEDESQVSFKSGQIVLVLNKDESGWWMCQVDDKLGWAPPSYLKKCDQGETTEGESDSDEEYLGLPGSYADTDKDSAVDSGISSTPESRNTTPNGTGKGFNVPEIEIQEYKALDSYEAQGDGQVSFEEGDIIQVIDKIEDGWWFVAKGQEEGWVPCSYLEPLRVGQEEDDTISSLDIEKYTAVEKYVAEEDDELSFSKGVTVDVLQKSLDGWWLVKHEGKTALAPATFLKKKEPGDNSPPPVRKVSVPTIVEPEPEPEPEPEVELTRTYRQPPRKQSVRMRVSQKKRLPASKFPALASSGSQATAGKITTIMEESPQRKVMLDTSNPAIGTIDSDTEDHEYLNFDPRQLKKEQQNQEKRPASPTTSDSEIDAQASKPPKQVRKGIQSRIKKFEQRLSSDSEDSSPSTPSRPPVALPRSNKPDLKPRPKLLQKPKSKSTGNMFVNGVKEASEVKEVVSSNPQMPPRPRMSQINRARSKTANTEDPPPEQQVRQPPRPRGTEIRRAREGKATPTPAPAPMPTITTTGDPGNKSTLPSEGSAFKPVPVRRSSSPGPVPASAALSVVTEESGEESDMSTSSRGAQVPRTPKGTSPNWRQLPPSPAPSGSSLAPPKPARKKSNSESDTQNSTSAPSSTSTSAASSSGPGGAAGSDNPLNQQMAETLIKYILASQDGALKNALRQCIMSDPEALKALKE